MGRSGIYAGILLGLGACYVHEGEFARGRRAFEDNAYERALGAFRILESDFVHMRPSERAQYAYLRGMTDYRLGYKADARHWLAMASVLSNQQPGALSSEWVQRCGEALADLNRVAWDLGPEDEGDAAKSAPEKEAPSTPSRKKSHRESK